MDPELANQESASEKLPVLATATGAWRALLDGRDLFAVVGAIAFVPAWIALLEEPLLGGRTELPALVEFLIPWALLAVGYAASAYVASHGHRFLLLGRDHVRATLPRWTRAETRLFWWYVGFTVLGTITAFLLGLPVAFLDAALERLPELPHWTSPLLYWALVLLAGYLALRVSLAFPAAAIGGPARGFPDSWRATAGHGWRLVTATGLALLPLVPLVVLAVHLFRSSGLRQLCGAALGSAAFLFVAVILAGVESLAYRRLVLSRGSAPGEALTSAPESSTRQRMSLSGRE